MAKQLIVVAGATATGKTDFSIQLANKLKTEIISADSRQVFREMSIGTAVPSASQLQDVRHHLVQHRSIHEGYDASSYAEEAIAAIKDVHSRSDYAILCGGSGLYIDAVLKGFDNMPPSDPEMRHRLEELLAREGIRGLQAELFRIDPQSASAIDLNNPRRIIRALEVTMMTGKPYSDFRSGRQRRPIEFEVTAVCLALPREMLYDRINCRVDRMMEQGLLDEAQELYPNRSLQALQTVGYRELFSFLDGSVSLDEAIETIKKNTRHYAKRQETWFRRDQEFKWVDNTNPAEALRRLVNS